MQIDDIGEVDIVVLTEDPKMSSGYSVNGRLVSWALAKDWSVLAVGEGADDVVKYETHGREFPIIPSEVSNPSDPRDSKMGSDIMPRVINKYNPDVVVTIVDPHRVSYMSELHNPTKIEFPVRDVGDGVEKTQVMKRFSKQISNFDASPNFTWVGLIPVDGKPLPKNWKPFVEEIDYPIAMSDFGIERMKKDLNITPYKIPHGLDHRYVESEKDDEDTFLLGTVNRNQFRKQMPRLIESWGKFYNDIGRPDNVEFYLHCDYNDSSGWKIDKYLDKYDIEEATREYEGYVSRERLMEIYSEIDVFCSATGGEGFGLTTIEAMSQGTPVVITDYSTSRELVADGDPSPRGKLVDVKTFYDELPTMAGVERALVDTDDFSEKIRMYYDKKGKIDTHGNNAREWVMQNHSWEDVADQWVELMNNVVFNDN
jgi:glycosyltransferase involved in cell wall biosynthesis